jgi:hypothetical protein
MEGANVYKQLNTIKAIEDGSNRLNSYFISKSDESDSVTKYYGLIKTNGAWCILKIVSNTGLGDYTYATGGENFSTAWTNHTTLTYTTIDNVTVY